MMANVREHSAKNRRCGKSRWKFCVSCRRTRTQATPLSFGAERAAMDDPSEPADEIDHLVLLRPGDLGKHRQRHDPPLIGIGVRELLRTMLEAAIGFKERQCSRIIHRGLYAMGVEMLHQFV